MATLYITSNGNSGNGTLRALLSSASAGDVIQPDPEVFPAGTLCEITLASNLTITKTVSICGAQTRIRITANGAACSIYLTAGIGSVVTFEDVDFVNLRSDYYGGAFRINGPDKVVLRRCLGVGNRGKYGGIAHVANTTNTNTAFMLYDSAFYGNYASTTAAFVYFQGSVYQKAWIQNCTYGANVCPNGDSPFNYTPPSDSRPNVVTTTANWITPPDASYSAATWTKDSWLAMNPRPIEITTNAIDTDSIFDLDGNFRYSGLDANDDIIGGALGAYELLTADLYWIGHDANGNSVTSGSFASATGWASSPYATTCGAVAPVAGQTLYIAKSANFYDAPGANSTIIIAPRVAVLMQGSDSTINVTLGLGATLDTDDKTLAMESPIIKNAPYSQLLAPIQQTQEYPAESFFMEGYIADFTVVASNLISRYPEYGKLVILGCENENLYHEIVGVYHARSILIRPGGSGVGQSVLFGDHYLVRVADGTEYREAPPEFHCDSFTAIDVEWSGEIKPVVYAKNSVSISNDGEYSLFAPFVVDLSEANDNIELTLSGQEIRNLNSPIVLFGGAVMNGGTFDSSLVSAGLYAKLTVKNCVVVGDVLEVVDYSLTIEGGSFAPTTIIVRSTSQLLLPPVLIIDGVSGLTTIQSLTVNRAQFVLVGGSVTINEITTIDATIRFSDCASVSYVGTFNQAYLALSNVASARFGTLVLRGMSSILSNVDVVGAVSVAEEFTADGANVEISGALNAPQVAITNGANVIAANLNATTLTCESSTLGFSGVAKGTTATINNSAINGGDSSRLSFTSLQLTDSSVIAQTLCSMTGAEYDALDLPGASTPFVLNGGSVTADSLTVYETESYSIRGTLAIESCVVQGAMEFGANAVARFDSLSVANTGSLSFATPSDLDFTDAVSVFEVGALALNSSATIEATNVAIDSMSYNVNTTIRGKTVALGNLTPIDGASLIASGGQFSFNGTNNKEIALTLDAQEVFATGTLRLAAESTVKANTINVAGVAITSGNVSIVDVMTGTFGAVDNSGDGELMIICDDVTTTSVIGDVVIRGTTLNLGDVVLADGDLLEGENVTINKLTSTEQGYSSISGTNFVTITTCLVSHNVTVDGGALNGELDCAASGVIRATGNHVKANIGSGVTLSCDSLSCTSVAPKLSPSSITATAFINVEKIVHENNLALTAPLITADSCVTHIDATLALNEFQTASFGDLSVYGEFSAIGEDLTTTNLTVDGTFTANLTDKYNSLELNSQGETTVTCANVSAGLLDIDGGTTQLIATDSATISDVDVAEGATLRIEPAPSAVESLVVAGTLEVAGPGAIQVAEQVALSTVKNVGSGRLELLLSVALEEDPTLIGDVIIRVINGTASDFLATATGADSVRFTWKAANDVPCTIEVQNGSDYDVVTRSAKPVYMNGEYVGSLDYNVTNVNGKTFRLYDGAKYLTDVALSAVSPSFFTCTERKVYGAMRYGSIFFAARIVNQLTGDFLISSDVEEAYASLYKVDRTSVSSYKRTPVANWKNVPIVPQILNELQFVPVFDDVFNFVWVPNQSVYCMTNKQGSFALLVKFKLTENRTPVVITFEFDVQ